MKKRINFQLCLASTSGDVVLTSKDSYIAWFLEDPDPNPPARQQSKSQMCTIKPSLLKTVKSN